MLIVAGRALADCGGSSNSTTGSNDGNEVAQTISLANSQFNALSVNSSEAAEDVELATAENIISGHDDCIEVEKAQVIAEGKIEDANRRMDATETQPIFRIESSDSPIFDNFQVKNLFI